MAKVSKAEVDKKLRDEIFEDIGLDDNMPPISGFCHDYHKINDRQYGVLLTDANGEQRYVRIGAIVAELREDMTAEELMAMEIETYQEKQRAKEEKALKKEQKIARDKAEREAKAKAKAKEEGN